MPKSISADQIPDLLSADQTVYVGGATGESLLVRDSLAGAPDCAAGVTFAGIWLPGINRFDYASLHHGARGVTTFLTPEMRPSFDAGKVSLLPLNYVQTHDFFENRLDIDLAFLQVSPPDADGACSFGLAADFAQAVASRARRLIGHVNPNMPRTEGGGQVRFDDLDWVVEAEAPLLQYETPEPNELQRRIGAHVAGLIGDGDTLQMGIGSVPAAVLGALTDRRDLKIHGGMVCDSVLELDAAGALAPGVAATVGMALGRQALFDWCATSGKVRFAPSSFTHAITTLAAIERLVAINSAIEVDLLGQMNAESMGGRLSGGIGGLTDFLRGAAYSPGGRPIVALASTARRGQVSRIVASLTPGGPVGVSRCDGAIVVTEHGVAELRGADLEARAEALIAIAAPAFRDELETEWQALRRGL